MKNNYSAWHIPFSDFENQLSLHDKLAFLVRFAVLAPSGHNTQPWKFVIRENTIAVCPDFTRSLPMSDENHRQLFISLGCAAENILIAADYYGLKTSIQYCPSDDVAALISFEKQRDFSPSENHLIQSILLRHTNRLAYSSTMPEPRFLNEMGKMKSEYFDINIITDLERRSKLAAIASESLLAAMDDPNFRYELSHYLKSNITSDYIGMPGFCFGMPLPVSFVAPRVIRRINMNRLSRKQDESVLNEGTPAFAIISAENDNREAWIRAGQLYEHAALCAVRLGMNTSPLAAAIQRGDYHMKLQKITNSAFRPLVFFRVGYPLKEAQRTPRMSASQVITATI